MRSALAGKPAAGFQKPDTVVSVRIDPSTGYLATPGCPRQKEEYYVLGTEPTEYCPMHGGGGEPAVPGGTGDAGQAVPE